MCVMVAQLAYLLVFRPLSSPLKMTVELAGAACECFTALLIYWLIEDPGASGRYGPVMQALMMVALGLQVLAQFGSFLDDGLGYLDLFLEWVAPYIYTALAAVGLMRLNAVSDDDSDDGSDSDVKQKVVDVEAAKAGRR